MKHSSVRRSALSVFTIVIGVSLFAVPLISSAQTTTTSTSSVQAQIQSLLAELASLQQQLQQLIATARASGEGPGMGTSTHPWMNGSSTPPMWGNASSTNPMPPMPPHGVCPMPQRDLTIGSSGSDVSQLQQFLAQDPSIYPQGLVTGFFGSSTAAALARFQQNNGIVSTVLGIVGPLTRTFFDNHCGGMNPGGNGMMGSTTAPWMPPASTTSWSWDGSTTAPVPPRLGWMGSSTMPHGGPIPVRPPIWMMGSTTYPQIPPPPMNNDNDNQGQNGQPPGSGWHGSIPPWQANQ